MKNRFLAVLAVSALFLSIALPAGATTGHVGTFTGKATVGKTMTDCGNDGKGVVTGGGLGLPSTEDKEAFYRLSTTVSDSPSGPGKLDVCGHVHPNGTTGIGAACGSSSGDHGKGKIVFDNGGVVWLNNVGWADAVGGVLPISGDADDTVMKGNKATITGLVVATGGAACLSKAGSKDGSDGNGAGATSFDVVGWYVTQ